MEKKSEVESLGTKLDKWANTDCSIAYGLKKAEKKYFANLKEWNIKGRMQEKLEAWTSNIQAIALFGSRNWQMNKTRAHDIRTWEYKMLRKALKLRRRKE